MKSICCWKRGTSARRHLTRSQSQVPRLAPTPTAWARSTRCPLRTHAVGVGAKRGWASRRFTLPAGLLAAMLVGAIVFVWPVVSRADDAAKTDDVKQDAAEKMTDPPQEPSLLDKLTKELLKEVDEGSAKPKPEKEEDKFERVAKGMRSASEKLDGKVTGDETTQIQERVIRDLDELIKQLQNPPPNGGGGGGGGGSSGGGSSKSGGGGRRQQRAGGRGGSGRAGQGQPQGGTPKPQAQGDGSEPGGRDRKDAEGSEERTDSERKAAAEAARKKKLEIDVWGHLPPHLRDQLLNTYGERMLPKYEQLVKQFYEALSEQSETKPRR